MFVKLVIGAIAVGILLVIAYVVIAQARASLPSNVDANITASLNQAQSTVLAGFSLIAVGVIVVGAFALISIWK